MPLYRFRMVGGEEHRVEAHRLRMDEFCVYAESCRMGSSPPWLSLLRQIRPMGFTLHEIRDLLATLEILEDPEVSDEHGHLLERSEMYLEAARLRAARLAEELQQAREFTAALDTEIAQRRQNSEHR